ncbi:MAG: hypothetical protein ABFE07_12535 [Armatimonadia bacterium]
MSGTYRGTTRLTRSGMTLAEILIAMLVLLVGIYAVAKGFPVMLHSIRGEGDRTAMARLAEETVARLTDNQYGLPDAITGGGDIRPDTFSEDLTEARTLQMPPNAQEDMLDVFGETFRVPAPYRDTGGLVLATNPARYVLSVGPTQVINNGYPYVYMLVPLQERADNPSALNPSDATNWFYADNAQGKVVVPSTVITTEGGETRSWNVSGVVVDYAWTRSTISDGVATAHYVQNETPLEFTVAGSEATATVHPAKLSGGCRLVPGQTRAWARIDFAREPFGTTEPTGSGHFAVDQFGTTLALHPQDAGLTLKVDYRLRYFQKAGTASDGSKYAERRELLMTEDRVIERTVDRTHPDGTQYTDVRLAIKGIEPDALFSDPDDDADATTTADGMPLGGGLQVHVLAVDLLTGDVYYDGNQLALYDPNLEPPLEAGFDDGVVTIPVQYSAGTAPTYLGHTWRFYYRTVQRHNLQVQKAPRAYVDRATAESYLVANAGVDQSTEVDYRTYDLAHRASGAANRNVAVLIFGRLMEDGSGWTSAESNTGVTVAVNYAYSPDANRREYVWGELHTVSPGLEVALNHATLDTRPVEILAVNGVSARARGWWLARNGRQRQLAVETVLLPTALGILPRVR